MKKNNILKNRNSMRINKKDFINLRHEGLINRIIWTHPEFQDHLISCGDDNKIKIWK